MSKSKKAFAELLIEKANMEESRRIKNRRLKEQREEANRRRRADLVKRAKSECNRVYSLYEKADERGLLGKLSIEKAKNIFISLNESCVENPRAVLDEVSKYENGLKQTVKEAKLTKMVDQQMLRAKQKAFLMGAMEYIKYYDQIKEIEKLNADLKLKDPYANTDAGLEYFKNKFPPPYNKCKFDEGEKEMFLADPVGFKMALVQARALGLIF